MVGGRICYSVSEECVCVRGCVGACVRACGRASVCVDQFCGCAGDEKCHLVMCVWAICGQQL